MYTERRKRAAKATVALATEAPPTTSTDQSPSWKPRVGPGGLRRPVGGGAGNGSMGQRRALISRARARALRQVNHADGMSQLPLRPLGRIRRAPSASQSMWTPLPW